VSLGILVKALPYSKCQALRYRVANRAVYGHASDQHGGVSTQLSFYGPSGDRVFIKAGQRLRGSVKLLWPYNKNIIDSMAYLNEMEMMKEDSG
jgi:hypothetical protein